MNNLDNSSSTPDPPRTRVADSVSPSHTQHPVRAADTRRSTAGNVAQKKPSPYERKALACSEDDMDKVHAGIGGPPKRRESMSGIGNNLRSLNHAGLGRAVGRSVPKDQTPSGLADVLRRSSIRRASVSTGGGAPGSPLSQDAGEELPHMQRRGSSSTSSPVTADASSPSTGDTVFPTNPGFTFGTPQPQRRRTLASSRYLRPSDAGISPQSYPHLLNVGSASPAPLQRMHTISSSGAYQFARARNKSSAPAARPRNASAMRWSESRHVQGDVSCGSRSPSINMTIGSPTTGEVVDVVGSYSHPSVVYAAERRPSKIGGAKEGKITMQGKSGLGGKYGKEWMADRPSNLGAPAPQGGHPESGLSKLFKSLKIGKAKSRPKEPSSPRLS